MFMSVGTWPFGFAVGRGNRLFISEAAAGAANGSSVSSYELSDSGGLAVISGKVPTEQTAACWLVLTYDGRYVYTANAGSASISGFRVQGNGSLELLDKTGLPAKTGMHPADMAFNQDGRLLFSLNNGDGTIKRFRRPVRWLAGADARLERPPNHCGRAGRVVRARAITNSEI